MNSGITHERARRLILDRTGGALQREQNRWLEDHLEECVPCTRYFESTERAIATLRMASEMPSPTLVRATKRSIRLSARSLGDAESHKHMIVVSCALAAAWGATLQPYLWRLFGWVGAYLDLPDPVWQGTFMMMWLMPAIVSALLLIHLPVASRIRSGIDEGRNG
jgi:hypothetical protein